ncbi:MAG: hypothetical protein ACI8WM_000300 [Burkholderiaceae bacterium]
MNKRHFLAATGLGLATVDSFATLLQKTATIAGPTLLTLPGSFGPGNRGPLDPALDQLMKKQGVTFDRAHTFDFTALRALPEIMISPTLEYDGKVHALGGSSRRCAICTPKAWRPTVNRAVEGCNADTRNQHD